MFMKNRRDNILDLENIQELQLKMFQERKKQSFLKITFFFKKKKGIDMQEEKKEFLKKLIKKF